MMSYINLKEYYRVLLIMKDEHNYSLTEVYDMSPFERDIFLIMIHNRNKEKEQQS